MHTTSCELKELVQRGAPLVPICELGRTLSGEKRWCSSSSSRGRVRPPAAQQSRLGRASVTSDKQRGAKRWHRLIAALYVQPVQRVEAGTLSPVPLPSGSPMAANSLLVCVGNPSIPYRCMPVVVDLMDNNSATLGFGGVKLQYRAWQSQVFPVIAKNCFQYLLVLSILPDCRHYELSNGPSHSKRTGEICWNRSYPN
jgi:hypothetical protein